MLEPTSITTLKLKVGKGGNQKSWGKEGRYTVEKKEKKKYLFSMLEFH